MIHSYGDRHLQTSAGFFISAPIDDGLIVEISVREFYVKCFIGYPGGNSLVCLAFSMSALQVS